MKSRTAGRICPTWRARCAREHGLLGLLPLHAAGYHTEQPPPGQARRTVIDRVVSSYAPTVRALRYARQEPGGDTPSHGPLIVAMLSTPGVPEVLHYVSEVAMLRNQLPSPVLLAERDVVGAFTSGDSAEAPTKGAVLK
jgi:hypothetical protein